MTIVRGSGDVKESDDKNCVERKNVLSRVTI